ncbi:MAG: hypothetical protein JSR46_10030, partial [Verrucomicrobia bacterium]|nr:hypothetical protein [Verrucomicrobiota bacterium]
RTKHGANRLSEQLTTDGITAMAIHGNKSQSARTKALTDFKQGDIRVLVATDLAARGIDIDQLPHVVNYEIPNVPEEYVHRIGRTGRAGNVGKAISLVCIDEDQYLKDIERLLKRSIETIILPGFEPDPSIKAEPIRHGRSQPKGTKPRQKPQEITQEKEQEEGDLVSREYFERRPKPPAGRSYEGRPRESYPRENRQPREGGYSREERPHSREPRASRPREGGYPRAGGYQREGYQREGGYQGNGFKGPRRPRTDRPDSREGGQSRFGASRPNGNRFGAPRHDANESRPFRPRESYPRGERSQSGEPRAPRSREGGYQGQRRPEGQNRGRSNYQGNRAGNG